MSDATTPSAQSNNDTHASYDALTRKRNRDKVNQRNKRTREREYTVRLEAKVRRLETLLRLHNFEPEIDDECINGVKTSADTAQNLSQAADTAGATHDVDCAPLVHDVVWPHHIEAIHPEHSQWHSIVGALATFDPGSRSNPRGLRVPCPSTAEEVLCNDPQTHAMSTNHSIINAPSMFCLASTPPITLRVGSGLHDAPARGSSINLQVSSQLFTQLLGTPEWLRLPSSSLAAMDRRADMSLEGDYRRIRLAEVLLQLRKTPDLQALCPAEPKPIDLLFGGSKNVLANHIFAAVAGMPVLPPEKFASSWLIYLFCRWFVWPSRETFYHLPEYFRPTPLQLTREHDITYDLILWPEMRDNLIKHGVKYNSNEIWGLLSCTFRIRGCFNKDFICREEEGELHLKAEFYEQFINVENWGILERFWAKYPELVQNLDQRKMLYEESLLPSGR